MNNCLELFSRCVIREDELSHGRAVEEPIVIYDRIAKMRNDFIQCGLTGRDDLTSDDVSIDYCRAKFGEQFRYRRFAARDAASEADPQRFAGAALRCRTHLQKLVYVGIPDSIAIQHGDPSSCREIGSVGDRQLAVAAAENDHTNAENGADDGRQQDNDW